MDANSKVVIYYDEHEPDEAGDLLGQSTIAAKKSLNREGWADYLFVTHDGFEHVERKQVGEILSDMDRVEEQLRKEIMAHSDAKLWLLIEGVALASNYKMVHGIESGGKVFPGKVFNTRIEKWDAWIIALQRLGVWVLRTNNFPHTCQVLVALAKGGQKPHTTLNRPLVPKISFHENPHVRTLVSAPHINVGVVLAERLVSKYGTLYDIITQSPDQIAEDIKGISKTGARNILRALGRRL